MRQKTLKNTTVPLLPQSCRWVSLSVGFDVRSFVTSARWDGAARVSERFHPSQAASLPARCSPVLAGDSSHLCRAEFTLTTDLSGPNHSLSHEGIWSADLLPVIQSQASCQPFDIQCFIPGCISPIFMHCKSLAAFYELDINMAVWLQLMNTCIIN